MSASFNPFYGLIETKTFPHARTLRTSLGQKIKDCFFVLYGNEKHLGLLEYLLIIARPLNKMKVLPGPNEDDVKGFLKLILLGPIKLPIYLTQAALAIALTITALPLILIVQAISTFIKYKDKINVEEALKNIIVMDKSSFFSCTLLETIESYSIEALKITNLTRESSRPKNLNYRMRLKFKVQDLLEYTTEVPNSERAAIAQGRQLYSLFRTNTAGLTSFFEKGRPEGTKAKMLKEFSKRP